MLKNNSKGFAHLLPLVVVVVLSMVAGVYYVVSSRAAVKEAAPVAAPAPAPSKGNGAPSGAHFNLNIIGVPKSKTAAISSGHRIFVPLEGTCKINLTPGDFSVLDGNCSDGSPAAFQLPNPDVDGDGVTSYTVWARPLGKPGGKATATTCAMQTTTDPTTGVTTTEELCSIESSAFVRTKGKSSFENVSKGFLTLLVDLDGDATTPAERLSIFDDRLQDYFWNYDNNGLKNLQVRFYQN